MITARFYVSEVTRRAKRHGDNATIKLLPAYADGANKAWATATPSGAFELQVNNVDAIEEFDRWRIDNVDLHITIDAAPAD